MAQGNAGGVGVQLEQLSALRTEADNLMERLHTAEERALQLEVEMANAQKAAALRKAEADKCAPPPPWMPACHPPPMFHTIMQQDCQLRLVDSATMAGLGGGGWKEHASGRRPDVPSS